jgi:hypothetical protein
VVNMGLGNQAIPISSHPDVSGGKARFDTPSQIRMKRVYKGRELFENNAEAGDAGPPSIIKPRSNRRHCLR